MHETIQQVLRDRMQDDGVAVMYGDRTWTWREHLAEAAAEASALIAQTDPSRPLHVGALLGNTPAMLRSMAAAALGGYVLCGINTTRRGDGLARRHPPVRLPAGARRRRAPAAARRPRPRRHARSSTSTAPPTATRSAPRNRLCRTAKSTAPTPCA